MATVNILESGHEDRVTVIDHNFTGNRILTGSFDHRLKVFDLQASNEPEVLDSWTAHDGHIIDVSLLPLCATNPHNHLKAKWLHPSIGSFIVSIGNDMKCKIWREEAAAPFNSGRRFRQVCAMQSNNRIPFVSVSVKHITPSFIYIALIDRLGNLSIYEPTNPEYFTELALIDELNVCPNQPLRSEETSFKIQFDPNSISVPVVRGLSKDKFMLSLAVTAMDTVRIYRSMTISPDASSIAMPQRGSQTRLYEAACLPFHPQLVRSVSWASGSARGYDLVATGCRDGGVRIYKVETSRGKMPEKAPSSGVTQAPIARGQQSSLTTAIAGRSNPLSSDLPNDGRAGLAGPFVHTVTEIMSAPYAHTECWSVTFDHSGKSDLFTHGIFSDLSCYRPYSS